MNKSLISQAEIQKICRICKDNGFARCYEGGCVAKDNDPVNGCGIFEDIYANEHMAERRAMQRMAEAEKTAKKRLEEAEAATNANSAEEEAKARAEVEAYNAKGMELQRAFCAEHKLPMFIPNSGKCWHCHKPVFGEDGGYSLEVAKTELVTGCHRCFYTFCD